MLELKNLTKVYKTKSENVVALNKINLTFGETGMVFVTGKSGSGKTTLLNVVGGLDAFDDGDLIIKGRSFAEFKQHDFDDYRNTFVGFVFQEYNLLDDMSVEKNISLAMELQGAKRRNTEKINSILEKVDLAGLNKRLPSELSGGQKQRVAIARALVKDPKIILTDEPTGALDTNNGIQVMNLLKELSKDRLVIVVSHNTDLAKAYADRIIKMKDGEIVRDYTLTRDAESKKLRVKEYDKKIIVRRGAKLTNDDLAMLQNAVEQSKDIQIVEENNFFFENDTEKIESKEYTAEDAKFIRGRLGAGNNFKLGLSNLKIKPLRLIVTILLCAIAFSVFGLFDTLSVYDEARLTANTLKNSNVPSIVLTSNYQEANGKESEFKLSQKLVDQLNYETGLNFKGIYNISAKPEETKDIANISMYYINSRMDGVVEIASEDELSGLGMKLTAGRLPTAYDEIAISEYYAMCLVNFGYQYGSLVVNAENCNDIKPADFIKAEPLVLTLNKTAHKIVGIVDTGAIDAKYDTLLTNYADNSKSFQTEFQNYVKNSFCLYGLVKDGFVENEYKQTKTLLQYKNSAYNYEFDLIEDGPQYFFNYNQLVEVGGDVFFIDESKSTVTENEILVNIQLFETVYSSVIDKFRDKANSNDLENLELYLPDLKTTKTTAEEKFDSARKLITLLCKHGYGNTINKLMLSANATKYDPTRYEDGNSDKLAKVELGYNEYKVVGFYTGLDQSVNTKALVLTEDGISNLGIDVNQGSYGSVISPSTKSTSTISKVVSLVKRTDGLKYSSSNNVIAIISLNHEALEDMSTLFLAASAVFAVFSIAMMANYISTSITNRREQIGILRALGTSSWGVLVMFLVQSLIIAIINIAISNVITAVSCIYLNRFFENVINVSIPLANYTIRQFWVIAGLSVGVAFISSLVPILNLSRKKPIETIRR